MKIELYTEVNFRGPTAKNGKCIALVECETKKGPAVKAQIETEQNTTYHRMSMIAILVGLRMLRPCEVTVYTPDQFLVTTINEGNMDKWKREEWRRPHGKEIKNKELWQELYEQTQKHRVTLEFSESTRYSDRLQSNTHAFAEAEGLKVNLCLEHHRNGPAAVHNNAKNARILMAKAQEVYERTHTREEWMKNAGKNYL